MVVHDHPLPLNARRIEDLPEDMQVRERRERVRHPLSETVFTGQWGAPFTRDDEPGAAPAP